jgi:hypothetical protein
MLPKVKQMKVHIRPVVPLLPLPAVPQAKAATVPTIMITAILLHQDKAVIPLPAVVRAQAVATQVAAVHPQAVVAVAPILPQGPVDAGDNIESKNGNFNPKNNFS